ncbi:MAG: amidohydrolase [Bacteroidetes bacterium]|nr:amidohydrolase [Bacteroidota bacterium]
MPTDFLNITLVQSDIVWEDKQANLSHYEQLIAPVANKEVVVLPEMFSTGFSMAPKRLAEPMNGPSVQWMKNMALKHRCILTGSLIIEDHGKYYNRLLWVQPDGNLGYYDKRHLFAYAEEDKHYSRGEKRLIAQVKGWRICLMVCYDLRFPVWSRNLDNAYDVLIYVANWPERRSLAWKTLLQARAIENQCYVIGVNRVGKDGNEISYSGDSSVFGPLGEAIWQQHMDEAVHTVTLSKENLNETRRHFPFLNDADKFMIL